MTQQRSDGKRRRLGRGLSSLLAEPAELATGDAPPPLPGATTGLVELPVAAIRPNPRQPRQQFDDATLDELARSIRTAGLMQPVVVRPAGDVFELVAGERRWRAVQRLGLDRMPAIVRDIDEATAAQWAVIENVQREDLNAIERAEAFRRLINEFGLSQQDVAVQVGLQPSTVSNHLRLLELSDEIQQAVRDDRLSMGHARALLAIANLDLRSSLAEAAIRDGWSVREIERRVRVAARRGSRRPGEVPTPRQANLKDLETRLGETLGTKVRIRQGRRRGSGTLSVEFYSHEQFQGLLDRLGYRGP